ncbi:hypothetical protein M8C21_000053, partial [Ambrosia artemisiifolia]
LKLNGISLRISLMLNAYLQARNNRAPLIRSAPATAVSNQQRLSIDSRGMKNLAFRLRTWFRLPDSDLSQQSCGLHTTTNCHHTDRVFCAGSMRRRLDYKQKQKRLQVHMGMSIFTGKGGSIDDGKLRMLDNRPKDAIHSKFKNTRNLLGAETGYKVTVAKSYCFFIFVGKEHHIGAFKGRGAVIQPHKPLNGCEKWSYKDGKYTDAGLEYFHCIGPMSEIRSDGLDCKRLMDDNDQCVHLNKIICLASFHSQIKSGESKIAESILEGPWKWLPRRGKQRRGPEEENIEGR